MKAILIAVAALIAIGWVSQVSAADFDGKKPFVCALLELTSCESGVDCERETPESANVPQFLFIDAKQNVITGKRPGGQMLTTKIERQRMLGELLVLEGAEGALSWTVTVEQTSGRMSLGAVGDGVGFVVFGACVGASAN